MNTTRRNTSEELEQAIRFTLSELDKARSWVDKENLRGVLAELAFLYTQDFPKYQSTTS